jgi:hypothetical protein
MSRFTTRERHVMLRAAEAALGFPETTFHNSAEQLAYDLAKDMIKDKLTGEEDFLKSIFKG